MSLIVPWIGLPLVLGILSLGCALALERAAGVPIARALLLPAGLAVISVLAQALTALSATAKLAVPAVVVLAVAGLVLGRMQARRAFGPWLAGALVVYLAYGAPVLASGGATFAGYITLDDTASWMAIIDHVMSHGRTVDALAPSSYSVSLQGYLDNGYPLGGFLGLGVTRELMRTDVMWLYQPFLAYAGGMLALALYQLTRGFVSRKGASVAVAAIAAQPATLYAYSQWGGIKEMVAAATMPLVAALAGQRRRALPGGLDGARAMLPLAVACSALLATLSFGAIVWIVPLVLPAVLAGADATRRAPWRALRLPSIGWLALLGAICSIPVLVLAVTFLRPLFASGPGGGGVFASADELGNLGHRLDLRQLAGIWPAGDFRLGPTHAGLTNALVALAVALALVGVVVAWRRGWRALPAYVLVAVGIAVAIRAHSSPWADGKSLAQSSPAIVLAALAATAVAWQRRAVRWAGWVAGGLVAAGVLWSNALAYSWVNLAPRDQLVELQHVAKLTAGRGPTLFHDAGVVGPRHILRASDAENPSAVRSRPIPLRNGQLLPPGAQVDIDDFDQQALRVYRTLVVRRAPDASRPASDYRLRWSGRYYAVWEGVADTSHPVKHLTLGSGNEGRVARCADVMPVARAAGPDGQVATVLRRPPTVVSLGFDRVPGAPSSAPLSERVALGGPVPAGWRPLVKLLGGMVPDGPGTIQRTFSVASSGRMQLWMRGSTRGRTTVLVDGRRVASLRHELNWVGRYLPLGDVVLTRGEHRLTVRYDDGGLQPGNRGQRINPFYFGPVVLSSDPVALPVLKVPASQARKLCGRRLDWIEALPAAG